VQVDELALVACHHVALDVINVHHACTAAAAAASLSMRSIHACARSLELATCIPHPQPAAHIGQQASQNVTVAAAENTTCKKCNNHPPTDM
jgi:hypothetical protein